MSQKFYVKSTQVDGIKINLTKIIKLGIIFIRIPPLLHTYRGNYKNCESHSRGSPPTFFSPAGWRRKSKNKFELRLRLRKKFKKNIVSDIKIAHK